MIALRDVSNAATLTDKAEGLRYSNVNPGGHEACTFDVPEGMEPPRGATIRVEDGSECLWMGRVYENSLSVDDSSRRGVVAYGPGMPLKKTRFPMIYIDKDPGRWGELTLGRRAALSTVPVDMGLMSWTSGRSVLIEIPAQALPGTVVAGYLYTAPPGVTIKKINYDLNNVTYPGTWRTPRFGQSSDGLNPTNFDNIAADGVDHTITITTPLRYVELEIYANGSAVTPAAGSSLRFDYLTMLADHGITLQSTGINSGLRARDVISYILGQVSGVNVGTVDAPTDFDIPQFAFHEATDAESQIAELNRVFGYDWGTWDSGNIFDDGAYFDWTAKTTDVSWILRRSECDNFNVAQTLADMGDTVHVKYESIEGGSEIATNTATVRALSDAGISQEVEIDGGVTTAAGAQRLISTFFALQGNDPPFTGSIDLTGSVRTPSGGMTPAHHMRANGANIRVEDLLPVTEIHQLTDLRQTLLPIKRVEVDCSGEIPRTTAAVDQTQDALSVLQARLGAVTELANR